MRVLSLFSFDWLECEEWTNANQWLVHKCALFTEGRELQEAYWGIPVNILRTPPLMQVRCVQRAGTNSLSLAFLHAMLGLKVTSEWNKYGRLLFILKIKTTMPHSETRTNSFWTYWTDVDSNRCTRLIYVIYSSNIYCDRFLSGC